MPKTRNGGTISPQYIPGKTYVFGCEIPGCGHLFFGNVWIDKLNPQRIDKEWTGANPE